MTKNSLKQAIQEIRRKKLQLLPPLLVAAAQCATFALAGPNIVGKSVGEALPYFLIGIWLAEVLKNIAHSFLVATKADNFFTTPYFDPVVELQEAEGRKVPIYAVQRIVLRMFRTFETLFLASCLTLFDALLGFLDTLVEAVYLLGYTLSAIGTW